MFNCIHGNAPLHLVNSIVMCCETHNVNTRLANTMNVDVPYARTELYKRSAIYRASIIWNSMPDNLKDCIDLNDFKAKAKVYFR